ncbi:hypothetical protein A3G14_00350 [Candidatus Curtissbacteria bacterium RIFCSPLOWO2_12_FULL_38_9]|uniref:Glycosyltransferase RgtA/B/C/D-like domain-containing protein n=1 Tax=Candidatus Curtissbacteria bacterium RIFCSPLOWO2_12_FULL_38_9 TaxID=1797735 RepID=A0A1F5IBS8_9BACT|nr:MAG: hypothetical protein A3G14_00350 [Candidatus Curtissbacteria bacterium RIFCSPLOWO2_12_FULL_38_9]
MIRFFNLGKISTILILSLIITLSIVLRIYKLAELPPGFYTDEASIGFNAYKILTTLRDEHGKFLPLFFEAFGEYKNALAIYPVVIAFPILGISEFATRLPQAILGAVIVFSMFFLTKELFNKKVGLISAFVIATAPWHVHLSRFTIESHNAFLLSIVLGTTFLLVSFRKNWEAKFLIFASISFAIAFYTYFATRIFTPLYLLGLIVIFRKEISKLIRTKIRTILIPFAIFMIIVLPFILHMLSGKGLARYHQVAFYKEAGSQIDLGQKALKLYKDHFDFDFIFFKGDSDFPGQLINRHSVNGLGLLYKWQLPFFLLGIVFLIASKNRNLKHKKWVIWLMLFLYPLGSVLSDAQTPYATRSVIGVVPYSLVSAYGLYNMFKYLAKVKNQYVKTTIWLIAAVLLVLTSSFFLNRFLNLYQAYANRAHGYNGFQYGAKQIVDYFLQNNDKYQVKIILSGFDRADALIKFYGLETCKNCYNFDPEPCNSDISKLIAVSVDNNQGFDRSYNATSKKVIYYPDEKKAFEIFEAFSKKCS